MLSINPVGSGGAQVDYYAGLGQEDYYLYGGEPPGEWWGPGAEHLRLTGQVRRDYFANLLRGKSPDGKRKLVQNAESPERRAAFDLTWSVPKSVSVAWSQADLELRKEIEAAGERAVKKSLDIFQRLCGQTRRGKGGNTLEDAGTIAAIFRHDTAREVCGEFPDPQLHWHTVILNVVCRNDGTTGSFHSKGLFRKGMKMALGALFRLSLSRELRELGFSSHRPKNTFGKLSSCFELDIIPQKLIEEFSKRRKQINEWMKERGLFGAKAAERAATNTRREKQNHKRPDLVSAWQAAAKKLGFDRDILSKATQKKFQTDDKEKTLTEAVQRALRNITEHWSRFSEIELLRYVAEAAQCSGVSIEDVKTRVDDVLRTSAQIVQLKNVEGEEQFTTKEMLGIERRLLESVDRLTGASGHASATLTVASVIREHPTIKGEQAEAVRHIALSQDSITCVNGMAGTGKTFLLNVAREIWERGGYEVIGTSLSSKATRVLEEGSGINGAHLHSLFAQLAARSLKLDETTIVVLDEAGMVGTRMMERLVAEVETSGAKLVCVGDHKQLQAINAGSPFRVMAERLGVAELREIARQREKWSRDAVTEFSCGEAEQALQRFHERGQLVISNTREESMANLVLDWHEAFARNGDSVVFAATRLEVATLNRLCQSLRKEAGELGSESIEIDGDECFEGDRVLFTRNHNGFMVRNGSTGTIRELNRFSNEITVQLDDGITITIPLSVYDSISLGYSLTTHKAQGLSVENSFILVGGPMTDREMSYVQSSRAKGKTVFYTDVINGGPDIKSIAAQMNRSRQKDMAHEHLREAS